MQPLFGSDPSRLQHECSAQKAAVKCPHRFDLLNPSVRFSVNGVTNVSKAASLMGRKSAEARKKKWGKKEFVAKMRAWGKLGGRPKGSGTKKTKRGEK
jgi:hypothetical protein